MKRILLIIAMVCLLSITLAGVAYAITGHAPVVGTKLVGYGPIGTEASGDTCYYTIFTVTNPDCSNSISLGQLSVVRADGTVLYEGSFEDALTSTVITSLEPHGVAMVRLVDYVEVTNPVRFCTVEVGFAARGKTLPLIGNVVVFQKDFFEDGTYTLAKTRVAMEKM